MHPKFCESFPFCIKRLRTTGNLQKKKAKAVQLQNQKNTDNMCAAKAGTRQSLVNRKPAKSSKKESLMKRNMFTRRVLKGRQLL